MNMPANNDQGTNTTAHGCCGPGRETVTTWEAFGTLPNFHHETDPTYQLLRSAGYRPVSIANYRVRHLRTDVNPTEVSSRSDGELLSLCQRCCTEEESRSAADQDGTLSNNVVDAHVWVAYFENQQGDCFVHVDGSGYDQQTVARHFGDGCCGN